MNELDKKILEVRESILEANSPLMLFDSDTDGTTSYLQLKKLKKSIIGYPLSKDIERQKELITGIDFDYDLVILFDIPFMEDEVLELFNGKKIIWADHHPTNSKELIEKYDILHLNPLNYDENDNRPSSFLAYRVSGLEENLFYAALGSVADFYLLDVLKDFYNKFPNEFNLLFKITDEKRVEIFDFIDKYPFNDEKTRDERAYWIKYLTYGSRLIEWKNLIDFLYKLKDKEEMIRALRMIEKMSPIDIRVEMNCGKGILFEDYIHMTKKYKKILKKALDKAKERYFIFEYKSGLGYTKTLSEELSFLLEKTDVVLVCFIKDGGSSYHCSIRGKNTIVNEIVVDAINGLDGRAGGHPYAAGVSVSKEDFPVFKERTVKKLSEIFDL